jgi:hypothetical protein
VKRVSVFTLGVCLAFSAATTSFAANKDCSVLNKAADAAREAYENVSQDVLDKFVVDKSADYWDKCMGGIIDGGFDFDLSMPSLQGMIDKACNYARSEARSQLSQATSEVTSGISADTGYGISASGSASATSGQLGAESVSVHDSSNELSNDIWRAIR